MRNKKWMGYLLLGLLIGMPLTQAQEIDIPMESEPYKLITAELSFDEPEEGVEIERKIAWKRSSEAVDWDELNDGEMLHLVAPPGKHWIEALIVTQMFKTETVFIPDPDNPKDPAKAKTKKVKSLLGFEIAQPRQEFTVKGSVPTPPPGPSPGPDPVPVPDMPSAEVQLILTPLKTLITAGDDAKAAKMAEAWADFHVDLKVNGAPTSVAQFKSATAAFLNAAMVKGGLQGAFPGFSTEFEKAFTARFGAADATLDPNKAMEFVAGLVWACQ